MDYEVRGATGVHAIENGKLVPKIGSPLTDFQNSIAGSEHPSAQWKFLTRTLTAIYQSQKCKKGV